MKKYLAAVIFLFTFFQISFSQQILGGDITWTCISSGSDAGKYVFQLRLFNQCDSGGVSKSAQSITVLNGPVSSISCAFVSETNISLACYDPVQTITCGNSGSGAVAEAIYQSSPITLSGVPPSTGWKFIYNAGSRPLGTNLGSNGSYGIRSVMYSYQNKNAGQCFDNSAQFVAVPTTRACIVNPFGFNHMAYDTDKDDISFSFAEPWNNVSSWPGSSISFSNGYSFNSPFPGLFHDSLNVPAQIDATSGEISFTSHTIERISHVYKVSSYRDNILISEVYRDFTIDLVNCPPTTSIPPLSNNAPFVQFKDSAAGSSYSYPISKTIIAGDSVEFLVIATDIQFNPGFLGQVVSLNPSGNQFGAGFVDASSGCDQPPCAVLDTNNIYYKPGKNNWEDTYGLQVKFKWQTDSAHGSANGKVYNFHFRVKDDWCPLSGISEKTVSIKVLPSPPNHITGLVYEDKNGNGSKDPGENGLKNILVKQSPSQFYYSTKSDGSYSLGAYQGSHTISITPPKYYAITSPAGGTHSVTSSGSGNTYGGKDFGVQAIPNIDDLRTKLTQMGPLRPGDTAVFKINYKNIGTTILAADIAFLFDSHFSYLSSNPTHTGQNLDSVIWKASNLAPGSSGMITVWLLTDTNATLGDTVKFQNQISPIDTSYINNFDSVISIISNSWDPNNKVAYPEHVIYNVDSNYVPLIKVENGMYMDYTINFQNTGNAEAKNVTIVDFIQQHFYLETFEFLGSSHPVEYDVEGRTITWSFNGINLPDSGSDYLGSMGFVRFRIKVDSSLKEGDTIFNSVNIYFDLNPPIYAISTVGIKDFNPVIPDGVQDNDLLWNDGIKIFPNPSSNKFNISIESDEKALIQYEVYSFTGKQIKYDLISLKSGINLFEINLEKENKGIYFILLKGKNLNKAYKLILN